MNNDKVVDLRQHTIASMQQEIMFLKGQNEALFKMLSYLTEQMGGEVFVPRDFGRLVIGSTFDFVPTEEGFRLKVTRTEEPPTAEELAKNDSQQAE